MRAQTAVAALLLLPFAAGCLDGGDPARPPNESSLLDVVAYRAPGPGLAAERTGIPAELLGLRIANVPTGFSGAEPNVGVTPAGNVFATAYEKVVRSMDTGRTWEAVFEQTVGETSDPMLWVDAVTGRIFSPQMFPDRTCSSAIWSDDEGETWTEVPLRCGLPVMDHQKIASGPYVGTLAALGGALLHPRLVTYCYNKFVATHCAVSVDGGASFTLDQPVDSAPASVPVAPVAAAFSCGGLNGHQHHARDGFIFLPYGYNCLTTYVAVSGDNGLTWVRRNLGHVNRELDPEVTTTPDGTAYYLYRGDDQRLHLLRSRDRFATVEGPFDVTPPFLRSTMFAGLTSGSDGRLAIAYLATGDTDRGPDDAPPSAQWHLYVGVSLDAGTPSPTFVTVRATPAGDPVQRGSICDQECREDPNGRSNDRNLLDFIDLSLGPDGRFWVSYADGCTSAQCLLPGQQNVATSRDDALTVAYLLEGPSLLAEAGRLAPPPAGASPLANVVTVAAA